MAALFGMPTIQYLAYLVYPISDVGRCWKSGTFSCT